jgi:hypothetical protein
MMVYGPMRVGVTNCPASAAGLGVEGAFDADEDVLDSEVVTVLVGLVDGGTSDAKGSSDT